MTRVVILNLNMEVWIDNEDEEPLIEAITKIMSQLNWRNLEEFGGCQLLTYHVEENVDEERYDCKSMYEHVADINKTCMEI
jgi:hypothetical protein